MPFQKWLLLADAVISVVILLSTGYTEIDWAAYMEEANGFFVHNVLDYSVLKGSTGPLVYPAGFTYIYSALSFFTSFGNNVLLAQIMFFIVYITVVALVLRIYRVAEVPFFFTAVLILSKRIHSIFLLRMFNDGICMLFFYGAVVMFARRSPAVACVLYSLAVSVKMNALLAAPGVLTVLMKTLPLSQVVGCLSVCAAVQLVLGAPFLSFDWRAYMASAFELGRVFTFKWTVNMKFIPQEIFETKEFGYGFLFLTFYAIASLWFIRWRKRDFRQPRSIFLTIFESNFVGVVFCRSLHYQFYSWFFHQLPLLLCVSCTGMHIVFRLMILAVVEYAFNVYPSTPLSSGLLMAALFTTFVFILVNNDAPVVFSKPVEAKQEVVGGARRESATAKKKQ